MGATKELPIHNPGYHRAAFQHFREHTSHPRTTTEFAILDLIRTTHQSYHVTATDAEKCALLEFAAAGKATAALNPTGDLFDASRVWKPVGCGIEKKVHPGKLTDHIAFGQYEYAYEGCQYLVYKVEWCDTFRPPTRMFYILSPRSSVAATDGHSEDTDKLLLAACKWTSELHGEIYVFDDAHWSKSRELWTAVHDSSWDEVILDPQMKASLIEDVYGFFDAQALYKELGVPWKRGVIFHGVPGNGKTISIKALMGALYNRPDPIPSLYVKSFENCNGPQASVSAIFAQARASAPCLLVFEDLDSLVQDETRSYFLNEVDGLELNDGILMIGSTNHLEALDPAISKRPSRFDRKYHYKIPGIAEREAYAAYWRQKLEQTGSGRVDFPEGVCGVVAALTEGFSFAYLKELFVMALLTIARGGVGEDLDGEEIGEEIENQETSAVEHSNPWVEEKKEEKPEETTCASCKALTELIAKDAEKQQEKKEPKKHTMPQVEIPQELRDIILLKVIKHQIKILLSEMDNTADDERPSGNARPKQKKARCPPKPLGRC